MIGLSCLVLLALPATPASAVETLTVNELGDASDLTPGDGVCDSSIVLLDQCTLRAAIEEANALANSGGPDQIHFNIPFPEVAPHTIPPASPLPDVTEAVIIDAATEPDFLGTPVVELDGTSAGTVDGLRITAGGSTVRGLAIHSFEGSGISLQTGGGNTIVGNRIGTNVAGTAALANLRGVEVIFGSSANTIGGSGAGDGNVISGNTQQGVRIAGSGVTGNAVQGNLIGTDAAGTAAVPNGTNGVEIGSGADGNTVGGSGAGEGNVISGNATGVLISSSAILGNAVQGNLIGTDDTGLAAIPNSSDGVNLSGAVATTVGGTTAGARNVIAGNGSDGIDVAGGSGNIVRGNYVGVDATGAEALANAGSGIRLLSGANGNTIGGTAAGAGNVISGNTESGVWITGLGVDGQRGRGQPHRDGRGRSGRPGQRGERSPHHRSSVEQDRWNRPR